MFIAEIEQVKLSQFVKGENIFRNILTNEKVVALLVSLSVT